ncbi:MAG: DUF4430 domain-containing protein [Clostridia bacterium]|nr:DUF4430 domain-containing protein [Clostridia bacterium]
MNSKILKTIVFALIVSLLFGILPTFANENTAEEELNILDGIIEYQLKKTNSESIQKFIDGYLTENAGVASEWYAIALSQYQNYDFSKYGNALDIYLKDNEINSASTRLKMILSLAVSKNDSKYIADNLDTSIGKQGIMSLIFGLHALNNGIVSEIHTVTSLTEEILSKQLPDGSFGINGKTGDIDTTAMAIQALAPYYSEEKVKTAIDKSIDFLSSKQQENGGFVMYGVNNPESASQVIIALSSLGIDYKTDERFIKNGNDILDAISSFRLDDGSFSHTEVKESNANATVQVLCAMVAYVRMAEGKNAFYILDKHENTDNSTESEVTESSEIIESSNESVNDTTDKNKINVKVLLIVIIIALAIIISIILLISKNKKKRNFIIIAVISALLVVFVCAIDFDSADNISKENAIGTVTLSIICDTVVGKSDDKHIPADGIILDTTEFEIEDGDTVYDILIEATKKHKIHIEINGNADTAYVEGIANIYEFDFGDLSGWMFFVNGNTQNIGCGKYELKPNDRIEWIYSCDMGEDLGRENIKIFD